MLPPFTTIDRYQILSTLGEGGLAMVYLARHTELDSLHALKVLHIRSTDRQSRALQEGRIQASLRHPNVVSVTDIIRHQGAPVLVMEFVQGPALDAVMRRIPLTYEQIDSLARGMMRGVAHAHSKDLIHRDLKPANVLVAFDHGEIVPRVTDFGLAKLYGGEDMAHSRTGAMLGTPAYMAPEQITDAKNVDQRADVFALGVVLYQMVCRRLPFPGDDLITIFDSIRSGTYSSPQSLSPDAPERMIRAIHAALHLDPASRPQSVELLMAMWEDGTAEPEGMWAENEVELLRSLGPSARPSLPEPTARAPAATAATFDYGTNETIAPPSEVAVDDEPIAPYRSSRAGLVVGVIGLLALLGVGAWLLTRAPDEPPVATVPSGQGAPAGSQETATPDEVKEPAPEPSPTPTTKEDPAPRPRVTASTSKAPEGDAGPDASPEEEAPVVVVTEKPPPDVRVTERAPSTRVTVSGVTRAYLVGDDGVQRQPGVVPPGTYQVSVFFDPGSPTPANRLTVAAGEQANVNCVAAMRSCSVTK